MVTEPQTMERESTRRRRRFSADSINDLLFWGIHFCVVAFSLGIVWYKIDKLNKAVSGLLQAQVEELVLVRVQVKAQEEQTALVRQQEEDKAKQTRAAMYALNSVLVSVGQIQSDITKTLEQTKAINEVVLANSNQSKVAAERAVGAASIAANASASTKQLVRSRVVTTEDKLKIKHEEKKLQQKQQQLNQTIKKVKKQGPNIIQRIFH